MAAADLNDLEFPRFVHKQGHAGDPDGEHLSVADAKAAADAVKDGWSIEAFPNCYDELPKDAGDEPKAKEPKAKEPKAKEPKAK